jgi:nicotinamide riboside transporter PnuC
MLDIISWLGCIILLLALELVARKRIEGFFIAIVAEALWIYWGVQTKAYALVAMSVAIVLMYFRAIYAWNKTRTK